MEYKVVFKYIGIGFIIAFIVIFIVSIKDLLNAFETKRLGKVVLGEVISIDYNSLSSPPDQTLNIKYTFNNTEYINSYNKHTTNWARKRIGEKVYIICNINNPASFWISNDINYYIFKIIFMCVFFIFSGIIIYKNSERLENAIKKGIIIIMINI